MKDLLNNKYIKSFLIILGIFVVAFLTSSYKDYQTDKLVKELSDEWIYLHGEIFVSKNKNIKAEEAYRQLSDEHTKVKDLAMYLQQKYNERPTRVVYVEAEAKGKEETQSKSEDKVYDYTLENGLKVARFESRKNEYYFKTYDLKFRASVVVGESNSTALVQMSSSADSNTFYEVEIDELQVANTEEEAKLFRPDLHVAARVSLSKYPEMTASLGLTLLHPTKCIDTVGVNVSGNSNEVSGGVIPFAYNLGCNIPVVQDLWIVTDGFIGYRFDENQINYGVGVGIGTKF